MIVANDIALEHATGLTHLGLTGGGDVSINFAIELVPRDKRRSLRGRCGQLLASQGLGVSAKGVLAWAGDAAEGALAVGVCACAAPAGTMARQASSNQACRGRSGRGGRAGPLRTACSLRCWAKM